jgi:hypothetical protein
MQRRPFSRSARSLAPALGGATSRDEPECDLRCGCHRLLARAIPEGIELRCSRCKENTVLTWERVRALEAERV